MRRKKRRNRRSQRCDEEGRPFLVGSKGGTAFYRSRLPVIPKPIPYGLRRKGLAPADTPYRADHRYDPAPPLCAPGKRNVLSPTELGCVVVELLKEHFSEITDPDFTAGMEEKTGFDCRRPCRLRGSNPGVLRALFAKDLAKAETEIERVKLADEVSDVQCEQCGRKMVCKPAVTGGSWPARGIPNAGMSSRSWSKRAFPVPSVEQGGGKADKEGRKYYGCSNHPKCNFISWYRPVENLPRSAGLRFKTTKSRGRLSVPGGVLPGTGKKGGLKNDGHGQARPGLGRRRRAGRQ